MKSPVLSRFVRQRVGGNGTQQRRVGNMSMVWWLMAGTRMLWVTVYTVSWWDFRQVPTHLIGAVTTVTTCYQVLPSPPVTKNVVTTGFIGGVTVLPEKTPITSIQNTLTYYYLLFFLKNRKSR